MKLGDKEITTIVGFDDIRSFSLGVKLETLKPLCIYPATFGTKSLTHRVQGLILLLQALLICFS